MDVRDHNHEAFGLLKLRQAFKEKEEIKEEQLVIEDKQFNTLDYRSSGAMTTTKNSFQNTSHHMASREYLQCEPVEIEDNNINFYPSAHDVLIESTDLKND